HVTGVQTCALPILLSGLVAALTVLNPGGAHIQTLMVTYALVYGVGISARNAGRPIIAVGQLLLSSLPILIVGVIVGGPVFYVLAGTMVFDIFGVMSITFNVLRTLRERIIAAETSAELAGKFQIHARTDTVTGLVNRAGLDHALSEMRAALPADRKLAMRSEERRVGKECRTGC